MIRNFSWWRRISERAQAVFFGEDWPAALASGLWPPAVRVWHERIELQKSLGTADRLRIAFASDFHAGPLTPPASIVSACHELGAASPDLILLGGDFVSLAARHAVRLLEPLRSITAPLGVFAVLATTTIGPEPPP